MIAGPTKQPAVTSLNCHRLSSRSLPRRRKCFCLTPDPSGGPGEAAHLLPFYTYNYIHVHKPATVAAHPAQYHITL